MLSGPEIVEQVKLGNIVIDPFDPNKVGPNSYDLRLDRKLKVYEAQMNYLEAWPQFRPSKALVFGDRHGAHMYREDMVLDTRKPNPTLDLEIPNEGLVLVPGVFYLGATFEHTETFTLVPRLDGRSSVGRLSIEIHRTAGYGDTNFRGVWTLELACLTPVRVYPNERICQINYEQVQGVVKKYEGKYQDADGPQASRKHLDKD
jgi:dCTP deaminase